MTLKEFIEEQQLTLLAFELYWTYANRSTPNNFPSEMGAGDWDEQLKLFDGELE